MDNKNTYNSFPTSFMTNLLAHGKLLLGGNPNSGAEVKKPK